MYATAAPASSPEVAGKLLDDLQRLLGLEAFYYLSPPASIPNGWKTYIYRFQLEPCPGLPEEFRGPLALLLYAGLEGLPRLRQEFALQHRLVDHGYPVARPVLLEE